ncbi:MAG: methylenetetrahydrofolate--tRNA-(uracil(54)-C(5))-methyltransferase (FADH(2)-oxidizing) TrmFO [Clostridiales bacterium]|nr:methylenetetrahydrofolate--tRNA-(uracil(54)-C(5))-methyltransferase (FADH(2)-oxidizing) TrmFO [Clostridiales bacterium]
MKQSLTIIGSGLAGCEAAWQAAKRGLRVCLYEMRPFTMTPAHKGGGLAELVCSNSLRGAALSNAVGLLKEEMRRLGSLIMAAADATAVAAGGALAVNRQLFSAYIEAAILAEEGIELRREELHTIPEEGAVIIAAGPLASPNLSEAIVVLTGSNGLFFHDAIAPIIAADSIDTGIAFFASRYDKGEGADYLNCPFNKEQYLLFCQELRQAELFPLREFEEERLFNGCLPIEAMARLGVDTMRFGPLKPVGLTMLSGGEPYAVAQLRREDAEGSMYNLVGFQTRLTQPAQKRVFRLIPGLEQAEFLRFGAMHRNTYIDSPRLLGADLRLKKDPRVFFAGQISGVEGYVESAAMGVVAGINAARVLGGKPTLVFPSVTAIGGLQKHISTDIGRTYEPMNINFGLLPPVEKRMRNKQEKNLALAERALTVLEQFKAELLL